MAEDVVIRIKATNLSKSAFDAARKQLDDLGKKAGLTNAGFGQMGAGFKRAASDLASFNPTAARATSLLGGFGAAGIAAGVGVGALTAAVGFSLRELVTMGDRLTNLSRVTGASTDALQKMEAFGRPLGISLEQMAGASTKLEKALGEGGKGVTEALKKLGLSMRDLAGMDADTRLLTVAKALATLKDPLDQAEAGSALLGRAWADMRLDAATIEEGERALRSVVTVSEEALKAGDALGDSWGQLLANSKALAAEGMAPLASSLADVVDQMNQLAVAIDGVSRSNLQGAGGFSFDAGFAFGQDLVKNASDPFADALMASSKANQKRAEDIAGVNRKIEADAAASAKRITDTERKARVERLADGFAAAKEEAEFNKRSIDQLLGNAREYWAELKQIQQENQDILAMFTPDPQAMQNALDEALVNLGSGLGGVDSLSTRGRFSGTHLGSAAPGVNFGSFGKSAEDARASLGDLNQELANLAHLADIIGPKWASVFQGLASGVAGLESIQGGIGSIKDGGFLNTITGIAGIASGVGAIAAPIIALLKGLGGPDIGRDVGRDIGANISEELEKAIEESGMNAQLFLREIFAEGDLGIDQLAEEVGDLFSMFERGEISEGGLIGELKETLPILIANFQELGPAGEEQIARITAAAERLGINIAEIDALMQSTFAPETMEQIAAGFGITNDQVRELAATLGVQIQTDLERMAATLGLTVEEFNALGAAVSEKFGIPAEQIDELLASMGVNAEELAAALGVDVSGGAGALNEELVGANTELDAGIDRARILRLELEGAARAAGSISIGGGFSGGISKIGPGGGRGGLPPPAAREDLAREIVNVLENNTSGARTRAQNALGVPRG